MDDRIYYTYAYLREDGTPYYVGRGKGRRKTEKHHRRNGKILPVPSENRILVLKSNLTFAESVKHETYMIAVFGRKDKGSGILLNMSDGGEGNKGNYPSLETRQKMSKTRKGRVLSQEVKDKISESHKGIGHTVETRKKLSKLHTGKFWWVNPQGVTTFAFEPLNSTFIRGRKYKWS